MALKGNQFFKAGRYDEAISMYREAVRLNPNSALNYGNRAAALIMLGRWEEALPDCVKAYSLDPVSANANGVAHCLWIYRRDTSRA